MTPLEMLTAIAVVAAALAILVIADIINAHRRHQ